MAYLKHLVVEIAVDPVSSAALASLVKNTFEKPEVVEATYLLLKGTQLELLLYVQFNDVKNCLWR